MQSSKSHGSVSLLAALLLLLAANFSLAATPAKEELIAGFLEFRETLAREGKVDVSEMSKSIRQAINEGERLEQEGKYQAALDKLRELEKYGPLPELPSFDVQMLSSWLYSKLGDSEAASAYRARADAMRELLSQRVGKGETPDDPVRALMINDIVEWARMQLTQITAVKGLPHKGRELQAVSYTGASTGGLPRIAYFEIDRRVQARANQRIRVFDPIPLSQLRPADLAFVESARRKRERFLDDTFPYLQLMAKVRDAIGKAANLDRQGKPAEALAALSEIESIRPIEDIPLPGLIAAYSALNGKTGNTEKQLALRGLLFGINQAIAHSGDGMSPGTAVLVIATSEEYEWLRDRGFSMVRQSLVDDANGKYDVLRARDASGSEKDFYFNITRMFEKYGHGLTSPPAKKP